MSVAAGRVAAVTGGTGFVGSHIVQALAADGWRVRLLARRAPLHPLLAPISLDLVLGDLDDPAALARLVAGAAVVVHAAGLVKARRPAEFFAVNEGGTRRLAAAVAAVAKAQHFVLVSSQAARQPELSAYAASKRAGEVALGAALPQATVLRPGIVYGPWDREGVALLRMARRRIVLVPRPPPLRLSMIHVRDLAEAVVAVCAAGPAGTFELSDSAPDGHFYGDVMRRIGDLLGRTPKLVPVPDALFRLAGATSDRFAALAGRAAIFGSGKAREILHRDWRPDTRTRLPAAIWAPRICLPAGLAETVAWWRG